MKNVYVCSNCDAQSLKWSGRCLECGAWGTLKMQTIDDNNAKKDILKTSPAEIIRLSDIEDKGLKRIKINISEVDRVLGGGIVPGSLSLLSGEPGIGKSTIVAQIADAAAKSLLLSGVVYVSGEESASQVKARLERLKCDIGNIQFISETNVEKILSAVLKLKPSLIIVDSIQTIYSSIIPAESGSISQIRASAVNFLKIAKENDIAIILIGHITKDGQIAGPKSLEHIVDSVIYLESEMGNNYRVLRAVKNRFGSINEIGVFEMTDFGFKEVVNPSSIFIESGVKKISGSVISCVIEGTRPFLVEIQALVSKTVFGYPQRKSSGFDLNRLQVLSSVLTKRAKINLSNQDIILNIVGGLKINDPSLDLAVCMAIASSLMNQSLDRKIVVLGEVGLGGEIRNIANISQRLAEAEKLGFTDAIVPDSNIKINKIKLNKVKDLKEVIDYIINFTKKD